MEALHYYLDMTVAGAHIRVHMDKIPREYSLVVPRLEAGKRPVDRSHEWSIVLTNVGSSPARNIRYVLEPATV